MNKNKNLKVSIVMGSQSDYKIMRLCVKTLKNLGAVVETKIISAHRTPKRMYEYATKDKFDVLIVANEEQKEMKFRKNFLEILDPSEYGKD